jgi:hypothetical protein
MVQVRRPPEQVPADDWRPITVNSVAPGFLLCNLTSEKQWPS